MKKYLLVVMIALFAITTEMKAVTAYPYPIRFTQPDKTTLTLTMKGDERVKWAETEDGYTLIYNKEGFFCYATKDEDGNLVPSPYVATDIAERSAAVVAFLENTPKKLFYSDMQVKEFIRLWDFMKDKSATEKMGTLGTIKFPVILVSFSNKQFSKTRTQFDNLLNQVNYGFSGSVADFYKENSYGQLKLEFVVAGPFQLSHTIAYYGSNSNGNYQAFARESVQLADDSLDFTQFDNNNDGYVDGVHIIFAGYGEEAGGGADCIWSHRSSLYTAMYVDGKSLRDYSCSPELSGSSGSTPTKVGVICHELGHVFGAPDFYDTDYGSSGGEYPGTGTWDLMGSGSWNNGGSKPAHHNPYSKCYIYGWATPKTLVNPEAVVVLDAETYGNSFYRVETTTSGEFFLLENRQNHKFDANIPGSGLLVYRVHRNATTSGRISNTTHPQQFYVVSAVNNTAIPTSTVSSYGTVNSASAPFGNLKNEFTDATTPSAKSWAGNATNKPLTSITKVSRNKTVTFLFRGASPNPGAFEATPSTATSITLTWRLFNYNKVLVLYSPNGVFGTPQGDVYNAGDMVSGGGEVLYQGYGTSFLHTGLTPQTLYRYKIFSYETTGWTSGVETSATTPHAALSMPYFVNFDNDSVNLPGFWDSEYENANYQWRVTYGNDNTYAPYSAPNCLTLTATSSNYDDMEATVITAPVNTSETQSHLTFRLKNQKRLTAQDILTVKYRTAMTSSWTTIAMFNTSMSVWNLIDLNVPSADFLQVAFTGTSHFGRGIGIDDVKFEAGVSGISTALEENINVNIYPNPAHNLFNISATYSDKNIGYEVFDILGRSVAKGNVDAYQTASINTGNWKTGVYVIKLTVGSNEKTHQLIIK